MGLKSSAFRDASSSFLFLLLPFLLFWDLAKLDFSLLGSWLLPDVFLSCSPLLLFPVCALKRSARRHGALVRAGNDWNGLVAQLHRADGPDSSDGSLHGCSMASRY